MNSNQFIQAQIDRHIDIILRSDDIGFENTLDEQIKHIVMLIIESDDHEQITKTTQYLNSQLTKQIPSFTQPNVPNISKDEYYPYDTMPYIYLPAILHSNIANKFIGTALEVCDKSPNEIAKISIIMSILLPDPVVEYKHHIPMMLNNQLCFYSHQGKLDMVEHFLTKQADINCENGLPLLFAVSNNNIPLTQFLIEKGANLHLNQDEAFRLASYNKAYDIVDLFLKKDWNFSLRYIRCINHYEKLTLNRIKSTQLTYKLNLELEVKNITTRNKI